MTDRNDSNDQNLLKNVVQNSVIAASNSKTIAAFQFFAAGWSRVKRKLSNG